MDKKKSVGVEVRYVDGLRDRVWCTLGQKIQIRKYSPVDIQFGCAVDRVGDETLDDTARRVIKSVQRYLKPLINEVIEIERKLRNDH